LGIASARSSALESCVFSNTRIRGLVAPQARAYTRMHLQGEWLMRGTMLLLTCLVVPGFAQAIDCATIDSPQVQPSRATVLTPVSSELAAPSYQLGVQSGVLAHAYDESQSVDQVLLRLRIEGCRSVAMATPAPSAIDPNDPSVYKPKTEFDNTPWRFDMNQNGKRMTADEFDAWMKARGVRVARGAVPAVAPGEAPGTIAPAAAPGQPGSSSPAQADGDSTGVAPADDAAADDGSAPQNPAGAGGSTPEPAASEGNPRD
jgi:hypothetical protein